MLPVKRLSQQGANVNLPFTSTHRTLTYQCGRLVVRDGLAEDEQFDVLPLLCWVRGHSCRVVGSAADPRWHTPLDFSADHRRSSPPVGQLGGARAPRKTLSFSRNVTLNIRRSWPVSYVW